MTKTPTIKSSFPAVTNCLAGKKTRRSSKSKILRVSNGDSLFVVSKQKVTRPHRWYAGDAEFGGTSKAAPWALGNNMPGYDPKSSFIKNGGPDGASLDAWLEDKGINRPENAPLEGVDIAKFRDHMSQPAQRLWYKK